MKLLLVFALAAAIVACLKGLKRETKEESVGSYHRLGL
jgi:ABC-type transporter Mla maintaining outer membrane lipid asymmetry permease subunit MlaE